MDPFAANLSRLALEIHGLDAPLRVLRLRGTEALSRPFLFELELASEDRAIPFAEAIDRPATLTLIGQRGERYVNGIVQAFAQGEPGARFGLYRAELVPAIRRLEHRHGCRIFQAQSAPEIVARILAEAGLSADSYRQILGGKHPRREYCVQYRESELAFVSRLMEEEGIYYYFEHRPGKHVLVMTDRASAHAPLGDDESLRYRPRSAGSLAGEHIYRFEYRERLRPGAATLRDYNFKRPSQDLEGRCSGERFRELEVYDYPGPYDCADVGQALAGLRLEELRAPARTAAGESDCRNLLPGYLFTLQDFDREDLNRRYLLTEVETRAAQPQALEETAGGAGSEFSNRFVCIPFDVPYRPARLTPKPFVRGTQTAIVAGPAGEEIYTDEHGRIKVQFHWDREGRNDERSSCWIRVSQAWAGPSWGSMVVPRIGQEVIVDFLEGDPDRPIVVGRVYHGTNRPPYALPANKTQSTLKSNSSKGGGGSNELRFEDLKGQEQVYIHAQKDQDNVVENNETTRVGVDRTETVGNNETIAIGANRTETVGANESVAVAATRTHSIGINDMLNVGAAQEVAVGAMRRVTVGLSQQVGIGKTLTIDAGDEIVIRTGKAVLHMKKDGTININGVDITAVGDGEIGVKAAKNVVIKGKKILEN